MREVIEALVADFEERRLPELTPRRARLPSVPGKVDAVVGMRRSGKTWFLFQQVEELARKGVARARCLYLNLEDERLEGLTARQLHLIPDAFYGRYPASRGVECWFLLDEVQNVPGWERFVRRLVDTEQVRIVVTGSSSRLLAREIATSLRGRSLPTELLPFGFAEFLTHAGVDVPDRWPPAAAARSRLEHELRRYLEVGGFPEVQRLEPHLRTAVLQDYVDVVLLRDVAERHGVANTAALRYLARRLLRSPSSRFSVSRVYNDLRSQGIAGTKDLLHACLSHLEDAFLLFPVERHARSVKARQVNPRKIYLVDHALTQALRLPRPDDTGHLLENAVYLELRRRNLTVSYVQTASGFEVDFLAQPLRGAPSLVQVCADLSETETRGRELRALEEAMGELGAADATVVTLADEETVTVRGGRVRVVPAWRWLLEEDAAH